MKNLKNFMLVMVFILVGTAFVLVAQSVIPLAMGGIEDELKNVVGIDSVVCDNEYYVNEPLATDGAEIVLKVAGNENVTVDLKQSNVANFSTSKIGNYEMVVSYGSFSLPVSYSVTYKKIDTGNQVFDFELNQELDMSDFKFYCYDYYDNLKKVETFENAQISDLELSSIGENKAATLTYGDLSTTFEYSVFHFSRNMNYSSEVVSDGDCSYQILSFVASENAKIRISKTINSLNVVENIYDFNLKRIDDAEKSAFISNKSVGKIEFKDKKFVLFENVLGNENEVVFDIKISDEVQIDQPYIKKIVGIKNFENNFILNGKASFENVKVQVLLSDNSHAEFDISKENFEDFSLSQVGSFNAKVKFYSFEYDFSYCVNFKLIQLYNITSPIEVEQYSNDIRDVEIVCYDDQGLPVAIKKLGDRDVVLRGFSTEQKSVGVQKATVSCFGASLEFEYFVV